LVFAPNSSRKTRSTTRLPANRPNHAVRLATTSGRFCSAAWVDFFSRQIQPLKRPADRPHAGRLPDGSGHLGQRCVGLLPDQLANRQFILVVIRPLIIGARRRAWSQTPGLAQSLSPSADARFAEFKRLGRLGRRSRLRVCRDNSFPKVH
jgi:hypothetical protein